MKIINRNKELLFLTWQVMIVLMLGIGVVWSQFSKSRVNKVETMAQYVSGTGSPTPSTACRTTDTYCVCGPNCYELNGFDNCYAYTGTDGACHYGGLQCVGN
jgi:hypothetical protein